MTLMEEVQKTLQLAQERRDEIENRRVEKEDTRMRQSIDSSSSSSSSSSGDQGLVTKGSGEKKKEKEKEKEKEKAIPSAITGVFAFEEDLPGPNNVKQYTIESILFSFVLFSAFMTFGSPDQ